MAHRLRFTVGQQTDAVEILYTDVSKGVPSIRHALLEGVTAGPWAYVFDEKPPQGRRFAVRAIDTVPEPDEVSALSNVVQMPGLPALLPQDLVPAAFPASVLPGESTTLSLPGLGPADDGTPYTVVYCSRSDYEEALSDGDPPRAAALKAALHAEPATTAPDYSLAVLLEETGSLDVLAYVERAADEAYVVTEAVTVVVEEPPPVLLTLTGSEEALSGHPWDLTLVEVASPQNPVLSRRLSYSTDSTDGYDGTWTTIAEDADLVSEGGGVWRYAGGYVPASATWRRAEVTQTYGDPVIAAGPMTVTDGGAPAPPEDVWISDPADTTPPEAATGVAAALMTHNSQPRITWTNPSQTNIVNAKIYRDTVPSSGAVLAGTVPAVPGVEGAFEESEAELGTTYSYWVVIENDAEEPVESEPSEAVQIEVRDVTPPSTPVIAIASTGDGSLTIALEEPSADNVALSHYVLCATTGAAPVTKGDVAASGLAAEDFPYAYAAPNGTQVNLALFAVDTATPANESDLSNVVSGTPGAGIVDMTVSLAETDKRVPTYDASDNPVPGTGVMAYVTGVPQGRTVYFFDDQGGANDHLPAAQGGRRLSGSAALYSAADETYELELFLDPASGEAAYNVAAWVEEGGVRSSNAVALTIWDNAVVQLISPVSGATLTAGEPLSGVVDVIPGAANPTVSVRWRYRLAGSATWVDIPGSEVEGSAGVLQEDGVTYRYTSPPEALVPAETEIDRIDGLAEATYGNPVGAVATGITVVAPPSTPAYAQAGEDGIICVESHHAMRNIPGTTHAWNEVSDALAYEGKTLIAQPNNGTVLEFGDPGAPVLEFDLLFEKTGTHYLWIRGRAFGSAVNDTCWYQLGDQTPVDFGGSTWTSVDDFTWVSNTSAAQKATFDVPAPGVHTLRIQMREDGLRIDRVLVTSSDSYDPSTVNAGVGPAESSLVS